MVDGQLPAEEIIGLWVVFVLSVTPPDRLRSTIRGRA
jgi:hypothetical protein